MLGKGALFWRRAVSRVFHAVSIALFIQLSNVAFAQPPVPENSRETGGSYRVQKKIKLGGDGSWDYLSIDSSSRRLFIGRSDRIMIVNMDAEKLVTEIGGMEGVHGITVVPEFKK